MRLPFRPAMLGLAFALAAAGCNRGAEEASHGAASSAAEGADAAHSHAAPEGAGADDEGQTLRTIMQGLSTNMQAYSHALYTGDTAQMVARSEAMFGHAHMSAAEMERIKGILGTAMPAFEAADERVHSAAARLSEISRTGNQDAAVAQLGEVQKGCIACHSQFKERLRTDRP